MKHLFVITLFAFVAVSCSTSSKCNEQDFVGLWVEPIPGMAGVQGVALEENGKARSINMATLRYDGWKYEDEKLILNGTSIGNRQSINFSDTLEIVKLTPDSLLLNRGNYRIGYRRSKEECGFSANPGEIRKGIVTIAHEVRTFTPEGSDSAYWLIDKSGYLQERYKQAGVPEWKTEAELELKKTDKQNDGFAKDYAGVYQVLRVIKLKE